MPTSRVRAAISATVIAMTATALAACGPAAEPRPTPTVTVTSGSHPDPAKPADMFEPSGEAAGPGFAPLAVPSGIPHGELDGPIASQWIDATNKHLGETIVTTLGNDSASTILPVVAISIDSITEPIPAGPIRDHVIQQAGADPASPAASTDKWVVQKLTLRIRQIAQYGTGNIADWKLPPSLKFQTTAGYVNAYAGEDDTCHADDTPFAAHGWATNQTTQQCYYLSADTSTIDRSAWVMAVTVRGYPDANISYRGQEQSTQIVTDKRPARSDGE